MMSAGKTAALRNFLSQLPESAAGRLAQAIEADRRAGGSDLPHDFILEALQPKLCAPKPSDPFDDLESYARAIRYSRPADFDEPALVEYLTIFAELSATLLKEYGIDTSERNAQRLAKNRSSVADVMDGFMERAPRAILAAIPTHNIGSFGLNNPRRIDLSRAPDLEKVSCAKRFAQLLVHSRPYAILLSFDGSLGLALEETIAGLRRYGEDIAREVRASAPESRAHAEAYLGVALELYNIVLGKQEADLLRRQSLSS